MARAGILTLRDVHDAKLYPLTADTAGGLTYGAGIDVPGIQGISVQPEFEQDELKGDAVILDTFSKTTKITGTVRHAQISMDILEKLTGGTSVSAGTTPNEEREFVWAAADTVPYWKLTGQCTYQGGPLAGGSGDALFTIHKGKLTNFQVELTGDAYATVSFDYEGIATTYLDPTSNKKKLFSITERETTAALSTSADTTAPTIQNTTPADAATGVPVGSDITFNYDEKIHPTCTTTDFFSVTKVSDGTVIAGTVTQAVDSEVVFNPTSDLDAATAYIASDSTGVRDMAGNKVAARTVINFTTA